MFEEEAEEYAVYTRIKDKNTYIDFPDESISEVQDFEGNYIDVSERIIKTFKDASEFGYNKANEWHDLRKNPNDLPTKKLEEKQLLLRVRNYTEDYILAYYMLDLYYSKNGKRFYSDIDCDYPINIKNIIAWKEIVFPELPKEMRS